MGVSSESSSGATGAGSAASTGGSAGPLGTGQTPRCEPGDWVEVRRVLLAPDERAAGLPPETASTPFVMWVKGFAQGAAAVGEEVTVETMSGRLVVGALAAVNPGYYHTFGDPVPELMRVGRDLRERVAAYRARGAGAASGGSGVGAGGAS